MFSKLLPSPTWRSVLAVVGLVAVAVVPELEAQVMATPPAIQGVTRRIDLISPRSGPAGTEVRVRAEGLRPNLRVSVAIGETQGCGYEVCSAAQVDGRGVLEATVVVPDWGHYDHFEVVMILDESFVPIAVSDPFHVVDQNGFVQRVGRIATAWPGCPALVTEDGLAYALLGEHALGLLASEGHELRVEGRIVEGACTLQNAIEVERMELVPDRPGRSAHAAGPARSARPTGAREDLPDPVYRPASIAYVFPLATVGMVSA